ncbi:glycosyltransferase [Enhygromyxa salina]|uniref:glycosyltransferase n=1 Tax=Enhygromyxa salina TaxID=215803 RepID=UPI0015E5D41E|nr:glycosyltransferase [Enhygromyxa salina]
MFTSTEGGAWRHSFELARALDPARFEVELLTRPLRAGAPARRELRAAEVAHVEVEDHEALARHLLRRRSDIVQHYDSLLPILALDLVEQELGEDRPRSIQLLHANGRPRVPLDLADVVVGVSASTLRWPGAAEALAGRARVIPNGVHLGPAPRRVAGEGEAPVILALTRLVEGKAVDAGLRALGQLERGAWTHRIVGDGPARAQLEALVDELGLSARVRFVGAVDDPRPELEAADLLLSTSPSEGFGLALAEAAEAGLALVTRRAGGLSEALVHGEHALVYDEPEQLPALLARALGDARERGRLGAAARRLIHARFDHAGMVRGYEALYAELAPRTRAR